MVQKLSSALSFRVWSTVLPGHQGRCRKMEPHASIQLQLSFCHLKLKDLLHGHTCVWSPIFQLVRRQDGGPSICSSCHHTAHTVKCYEAIKTYFLQLCSLFTHLTQTLNLAIKQISVLIFYDILDSQCMSPAEREADKTARTHPPAKFKYLFSLSLSLQPHSYCPVTLFDVMLPGMVTCEILTFELYYKHSPEPITLENLICNES